MTVGQPNNSQSMDQILTSIATQAVALYERMRKLNVEVNSGSQGQPVGVAYLESIGYSAADAAVANQYIGWLANLEGVYYGTATVAADFNFDNALSPLWGFNI